MLRALPFGACVLCARRAALLAAALLFAHLLLPPTSGSRLAAAERRFGNAAGPILPGEFEQQQALLLAWNADDEGVEQALTAIAANVCDKLAVVVLVPDEEYRHVAIESFLAAGIDPARIRFVAAPADTIWVRDYGPLAVRTPDGRATLVDAEYETGTRGNDDRLPAAISPLFGLPIVEAPLCVEGGNLLSNGRGLALATIKLREANRQRGLSDRALHDRLRAYYGCEQIVFLEPLIGEPTGHVDMFATFVSPQTVVVGRYGDDVDPVNAEILDRNAARLEGLQTAAGPLRVVRVPMPPPGHDTWPSYTNVLYANGTLLLPSYPGAPFEMEDDAVAVYSRLLPAWKIVPIDCNYLISLGGGVHCVTMNLCRIERLPDPAEGMRAVPRPPGFPVWSRWRGRLVVDDANSKWAPVPADEHSEAWRDAGFAAPVVRPPRDERRHFSSHRLEWSDGRELTGVEREALLERLRRRNLVPDECNGCCAADEQRAEQFANPDGTTANGRDVFRADGLWGGELDLRDERRNPAGSEGVFDVAAGRRYRMPREYRPVRPLNAGERLLQPADRDGIRQFRGK